MGGPAPTGINVQLVHPAQGLAAQLLELPCQPLTDLSRTALDLTPIARLNLKALRKAAFEAPQRGGVRVLDGGVNELVKQEQGVVVADLCDVARAGIHLRMIKRR